MKKQPFDPKNLTKIGFFEVKCPFFHELHLLFFLSVDLLLNFDYFQPSGTYLDFFGTRIEHNFAPLGTIWSGFELSHYK